MKPFRFGLLLETSRETPLAEVLDHARRAEDAGCSIVLGTDRHSGVPQYQSGGKVAARGMERGTPFAAAHTFGQTGPFRPRNLWGENVVFAGSGTQPGVGVPMVLISGRLAAERVLGPDPSYRSRAWP